MFLGREKIIKESTLSEHTGRAIGSENFHVMRTN